MGTEVMTHWLQGAAVGISLMVALQRLARWRQRRIAHKRFLELVNPRKHSDD